MTKAKISIELPGSKPVEIDVDVHEEGDEVTVVFTPTEARIHTQGQPKVVPS